MADNRAEKKWFSADDVELAKGVLSELPDLSRNRLTKNDVLAQLKGEIIELANKKGYSNDDIKKALEDVGIQASTKAIREILNSQKKSTAGAVGSRGKRDKNSTATQSSSTKNTD